MFWGLFDFFALWLHVASHVWSTELHVNYDLMTFGDTLCEGSSFGPVYISANMDNIWNIRTRMSVYPWFFVGKLRAGNVISALMNENSQDFAVP